MVSKLLEEMFRYERWVELLEIAHVKNLNIKLIKELTGFDSRAKLFNLIKKDEYNIFPPRIGRIPKDTPGEFREVYINTDIDRIVLTLINMCLCELFSDMIHPKCKSYQKGVGTQKVVKLIATEIEPYSSMQKHIGYKSDFSKYFDTVKIEAIDNVFDIIEKRLGFDKGTEPVMNLLRRYYHQDVYFDINGNVQSKYQSLKQGCAVASFLANVILYELDDYMSNKYKIYYRYSDDLVVIDDDTSEAVEDINKICSKYGVKLNPKKVAPLYSNKWFKFLGFNIKGGLITLSASRIKKFQKEIEARTIKKKKCSSKQARRNVNKFLYEGKYSWAESCLVAMNVKHDIDELNSFIMDCIRACETGKKRIGGLGCCFDRGDYVIVRGKGRNVKSNKSKTDKHIEQYLSIGCLSNCMNICKEVYDATVRSI